MISRESFARFATVASVVHLAAGTAFAQPAPPAPPPAPTTTTTPPMPPTPPAAPPTAPPQWPPYTTAQPPPAAPGGNMISNPAQPHANPVGHHMPGAPVVMPPSYLSEPGRFPRKQPYDEGVQTPLGYHEERESRKPLVVAGAITFGTIYGINVLVAGGLLAEKERGAWLLVPLAGPVIHAVDTSKSDRGIVLGMTLVSMGQAAGAALFIAGVAAKRKVWVRNDVLTAEQYEPQIGIGPGSVSASFSF